MIQCSLLALVHGFFHLASAVWNSFYATVLRSPALTVGNKTLHIDVAYLVDSNDMS